MDHLERQNILVDYQHRFRHRRSCESQLLINSHDLASILNRRSQVDVAVLDFAKAFDKVPHQRLLKKLCYYNLHGNVVGWIESFPADRTQPVIGHTSALWGASRHSPWPAALSHLHQRHHLLVHPARSRRLPGI